MLNLYNRVKSYLFLKIVHSKITNFIHLLRIINNNVLIIIEFILSLYLSLASYLNYQLYLLQCKHVYVSETCLVIIYNLSVCITRLNYLF